MKITLHKNEILEKFGLPVTSDLIVDGYGSEMVNPTCKESLQVETIEITDDGKLKTSEIIKKMKEKFNVWCIWSDEQLDEQFPAPKNKITRKFLKSQEPDAETLGLSINQTLGKGITQEQSISLRERLLLEIAYFDETGEHLDLIGWTLCGGSRSAGGSVPSVDWNPYNQKVGVDWFEVDDSDSERGLRSCIK